MSTRFPPDFTWGAATSSYQIEGAHDVDGRGPSIWDTFCRTPGKVVGAENGDVACDHYHRLEQDLDMMAELGLQAYRFSVAWPRIIPGGTGPTEPRGLDFYDRLVDGLLARGITPWVTLYHWDLPQPLQDAGGWPHRGIVDPFVHYADVVARRLGDRVQHWITHNEPWCIALLGHEIGEHAPGLKDRAAALAAAHHVLLSHGQAVPVIRAAAPDAKVGIVLNLCPNESASPSKYDKDATRYFDGWFNRWFLDPLYGRGYPQDVLAADLKAGKIPSLRPDWLQPGDLEEIAAPTDFLGINYYSRAVIRSDKVPEADNAPRTVHDDGPRTDMGWEVAPDSLRQLLHRLHRDYGVADMAITENGCAYPTGPDAQGRVQDTDRIVYFDGHLRACAQAIAEGAPLSAYFAWSLMDNFEWAFGYAKRFGLVHVDYETQKRTPKDSALWYRDVIGRGGL